MTRTLGTRRTTQSTPDYVIRRNGWTVNARPDELCSGQEAGRWTVCGAGQEWGH